MKRQHLDFGIIDYNEKVEKIAEQLGDLYEEAPNVLTNALKDTLRNIRKETVKQANKIYDYNKYGKPLAATNKTLRVKVGTKRDSWYSSLTATGPMSELADFMITPNVTKGKRPPAYSARVKRDSPLATFDSHTNKPFLVYFKAGKTGRHKAFVYRAGKDRFPLKKILAPSVPSMLENSGLHEIAAKRMQTDLEKQIENCIRKTLANAGK